MKYKYFLILLTAFSIFNAANELDDYEEGSWTPALTGGFFSGATYTIQNGTYV